jgi:hypothetical protein
VIQGWLKGSGLDGRYLAIWLFVIFPPLFLSFVTPAASWRYLPFAAVGLYFFLLIAASPTFTLFYRKARKSGCSGILAAWRAAYIASVSTSMLLGIAWQRSERSFDWLSLLQKIVGLNFYTIVMMSIAVPFLYAEEVDLTRGDVG